MQNISINWLWPKFTECLSMHLSYCPWYCAAIEWKLTAATINTINLVTNNNLMSRWLHTKKHLHAYSVSSNTISDFALNNKPKFPFRSQDPVGSIWVVTKQNLERTARQNLEMILTQTQAAEWSQVTTL